MVVQHVRLAVLDMRTILLLSNAVVIPLLHECKGLETNYWHVDGEKGYPVPDLLFAVFAFVVQFFKVLQPLAESRIEKLVPPRLNSLILFTRAVSKTVSEEENSVALKGARLLHLAAQVPVQVCELPCLAASVCSKNDWHVACFTHGVEVLLEDGVGDASSNTHV